MSGMLQIPATMNDRAGGTMVKDTFDACLDAWVALDREAREQATITVEGSIPEGVPTWFSSMDAPHIAKAVAMREDMEWP